MKKNSGYTLLELLMVVGLIGLVFAIGVPQMTSFIQNDRLTTNINTMVGHLAYARSEAVKRSQQVAVCASSNGSSCNTFDFHLGWLIYIDSNNSTTFDSGEQILRVQQALGNNNVITTSGTSRFVYDYRGYLVAGQNEIIELCDNRSGPHGKQIWMNNIGRTRLVTGVSC